jgi:YHS domain-containing protein
MATVKDPICGKDVDTLRARAVGIFGGQTYYFCSQECKAKYVDPRKTPRPADAKKEPEKKAEKLPEPKAPEPKKAEPKKPEPKKPEAPPAQAHKSPVDDQLEELPPMAVESAGGDLDLPDLTPVKPRKDHSASVKAEIKEMKRDSRRWAVIIVILAALVVTAVVLSLRN